MNKELKEIEDWNRLRSKLNNDYDYNSDWKDAIELFVHRLESKFFEPLESIIKKQRLKGEGFTIVTVQCALIESLASFRTGQIFLHKAVKGQPKYIYNHSGKMFTDFLLSASIFENNFYKKNASGATLNDPFNAQDFYTNVRCGLMHEAKTKGNWHINATKKNIEKDKIFLEQDGLKIKILRSVLHYRLKQYLTEYSSDLTQDSNNYLRRLFARKMDNLFEIAVDTTYDWWLDY